MCQAPSSLPTKFIYHPFRPFCLFPIHMENTISICEKYNFQLGKIQFTIMKNTIYNWEKYNLQLGKIYFWNPKPNPSLTLPTPFAILLPLPNSAWIYPNSFSLYLWYIVYFSLDISLIWSSGSLNLVVYTQVFPWYLGIFYTYIIPCIYPWSDPLNLVVGYIQVYPGDNFWLQLSPFLIEYIQIHPQYIFDIYVYILDLIQCGSLNLVVYIQVYPGDNICLQLSPFLGCRSHKIHLSPTSRHQVVFL